MKSIKSLDKFRSAGADRPDVDDSGYDSFWGEDADPPISSLTRTEAQALVARHPSMTVWQALASQALFGVLVALIWGALSRSLPTTLSALYGVAVAVLPSALMARGVFGRRGASSGAQGVGGLLVWEILKLLMVGAMLAMAPVWIVPLDWVAMLVTLVLSLKVVGVALLIWQGRAKKTV
ncbi:MAG: ATP synthase subunit I [Proteobacteria bacterium]|uniref:ATP synthase subunit I n=1 Tax=Aquabacterium sp. TaxID=1872578 RepID=UPI0035C6DFD2|nr:ATP synthase subunit I [Pseudomonadota bacterium]